MQHSNVGFYVQTDVQHTLEDANEAKDTSQDRGLHMFCEPVLLSDLPKQEVLLRHRLWMRLYRVRDDSAHSINGILMHGVAER